MSLESIWKIPVEATSRPFASAFEKCGFEAAGYLEEEYFIRGAAKVYSSASEVTGFSSLAGGSGSSVTARIASSASACAPVAVRESVYVNRILVRKPADARRFSGNVVVEILNPTAKVDLDRIWVLTWKKFLRDGDAWVGLTSKPDVLPALVAFDAARYRELDWPGLETGLVWDMLTDLAELLRSRRAGNPVLELTRPRLYLSGWSQSACYLIRYVNSFAHRLSAERDIPVYDGYLGAGAVHSLGIPLNLEGWARALLSPLSPPASALAATRQPYIAIQTESENADFGGYECRESDSDDPGFLYRIYEIPGSSHDSKYSSFDYLNHDSDLRRRGFARAYEGKEGVPNDYPAEFLFNAAFRNLFAWVCDRVSPLHAGPIPVDPVTRKNLTDAFGNARGGLRSPFIDVPLGRYRSYSTESGGVNRMLGHTEYFSAATLTELYASLSGYLALVERSARELAVLGGFLHEDIGACLALARERAMERGLF